MQNSTSNPSLHSATATASTHEATERAALAAACERARERVLAGYPLTTAWLSPLTSPADEFPDEKTMPYAPEIPKEALARAYERARERVRAGSPPTNTRISSLIRPTDESPDEKTTPCGPAVPDAVGAPGLGMRLTLDEVLWVLREPSKWALARAVRQAQGDPADLAALARLRTAYQSRLLWFFTGGALGQSHPDVRPTDVVIAVGLFAHSIDPNLAQRAAAGLRDVVRNVLAAVTPVVEAHSRRAIEASRPATSRSLGLDDVLALFGAPHVAHPSTSAGCCPHGHPL